MATNIYKPDFIAAGKFLALLAAPFALLAFLFYGAIAYLYISTKFSPPAYSSSISIPELNATIKLEFYGVWDETQESGKFLTVSTPHGSVRSEIAGIDWVHNARTSIYETPQHDVAVLSPMEDDYIIHLQTLELKTLRRSHQATVGTTLAPLISEVPAIRFSSSQLRNSPSAFRCAHRATSIGRKCLVANIGRKIAIHVEGGYAIMRAAFYVTASMRRA